jgi:2-oxoglutarate ferredoxin oxidoreductase subunit delta
VSAVGWVDIDAERCKGCELCIPACPFEVLSMSDERNERGYRYPVLLPGCTGCRVCNEVCPDFVFTVYREARSPAARHVAAGPAREDEP